GPEGRRSRQTCRHPLASGAVSQALWPEDPRRDLGLSPAVAGRGHIGSVVPVPGDALSGRGSDGILRFRSGGPLSPPGSAGAAGFAPGRCARRGGCLTDESRPALPRTALSRTVLSKAHRTHVL